MYPTILAIGPKQDDPHVPPPPPPEMIRGRLPVREDDIGPKQDDPHVPHVPQGVHVNIKTNIPKAH